MTRYPKVNGCVGSMAPIVPVVKSTIWKRRTKVKSYKQESGMTQIKEQLAPTVTTTTKEELWCQVEQPTKKLRLGAVMVEDIKKEQQT